MPLISYFLLNVVLRFGVPIVVSSLLSTSCSEAFTFIS